MATIELRKGFFFRLAFLHHAKFLSYGVKNYIIAFCTRKNNSQTIFSNNLPQDSITVKNANFFYDKISTLMRNKAIEGILTR